MKLSFMGSAALLLWASIFTPTYAKSLDSTIADWTATTPLVIKTATSSDPQGYTPLQIKNAYGFNQVASKGNLKVIGIVDAYDNPHAAENLQVFSQRFSLNQMYGTPGNQTCTIKNGPHPCFQKVYANTKPSPNAGWAVESDLDLQWSHAMADRADILLVESKNSSLLNLLAAIDKCVSLGADVVSMSWGGPEFSSEMNYRNHFSHGSTTFVASSGDSGNGAAFPAVLPTILSVGGTTLSLDSQGKRLSSEIAWSGSGGGISSYVAMPDYQQKYLHKPATSFRQLPDVSYNSNPSTGYSVYTYTAGKAGWITVGGTSAAAPQWAALIALSNHRKNQVVKHLESLYHAASGVQYKHNFTDIIQGSNGRCGYVCTTRIGYDTVTGLGSPLVSPLAHII
jgi:subtilase family serine protease